ncbi:CheY chemotaxis protein or a CheY-like REC [Nostoc flagelliforme CCNUN1]|uniref:CheY chemotaxis protein or a CheY-like REC n=1 Tax=Nostoc flagelliforme CCNUN1 TaxID=2038116 RepID=A0A2K8SW35_9NOSO|nr:CheY chemotaxis protein or a CheY-like REC [Nostoc flagelliforme CCNUN1]
MRHVLDSLFSVSAISSLAGEWGVGSGGRGSKSVPNAPCPMPHAQCPMPNAPCPMPHAPCPMPHAPCPMPNSH